MGAIPWTPLDPALAPTGNPTRTPRTVDPAERRPDPACGMGALLPFGRSRGLPRNLSLTKHMPRHGGGTREKGPRGSPGDESTPEAPRAEVIGVRFWGHG